MQSVIDMRGISKDFPGVRALDGVNLTLYPGKVHGLVGENGAGKSTLMKIMSGTYIADEGEIQVDGKTVQFKTESDALEAGIVIIPQELSYVRELTIEENIFLGREPLKGKFLDIKKRDQTAYELIRSMGLSVLPGTKMSELSIAQCQMVEIIKAISRNARVIIMDEPTSSLTEIESKKLFEHIRNLSSKGISIVYISHKLEEVLDLCDDIVVLRDSKFIGKVDKKDASQEQLIAMMVGREIGMIYSDPGIPTEEEVLRVENLGEEGVFSNISFTLHKGEVLGFSGMVGAGRSEVMRAIFGLDSHSEGKIFMDGKEIIVKNTWDAINAGIGMVTEDRASSGFIPNMSVMNNILLPNVDLFARFGFILEKKIKNTANEMTEKLSIKIPNVFANIINLSGGNQQKVILAKWLVRKCRVLILDEPTRGIDVGAKEEIYSLIKEMAKQGMAIIVISSEMQEVIGVSSRVAVMDGGKILKEFSHQEVTQDLIMKTIVEGGRKL